MLRILSMYFQVLIRWALQTPSGDADLMRDVGTHHRHPYSFHQLGFTGKGSLVVRPLLLGTKPCWAASPISEQGSLELRSSLARPCSRRWSDIWTWSGCR